MKLRIEGNSLRIRLSRSEVEKISRSEQLEEWTSFGNSTFVYALQIDRDGRELSAAFDGNKMTMFVPSLLMKDWAINEVVGYEATTQVSGTQSLHLLLEKDFKCLDAREDQADNYPHPAKTA